MRNGAGASPGGANEPESLSERRPTFTTRPPYYPRKIALEEAVSTSVFNASRTTPLVPGTSDMEYATPDYGPGIERRLSDPGLQVADYRQDSLIPLLRHAQLPHEPSVKDQPKQLSTISRNTVRHQPTDRCQVSAARTFRQSAARYAE
jgi:hypothetical protein